MLVGEGAAPAGVLSAKHAPGRRRGSARWPIRAACQELADGWPFRNGRPTKSAARCRKENAAMARREAPVLSRGSAATKNNGCATWRAIPLSLERGVRKREEDGPTRGLAKQYGR